MSGFIPIVSSSPPPLDDVPSFEADQDEDWDDFEGFSAPPDLGKTGLSEADVVNGNADPFFRPIKDQLNGSASGSDPGASSTTCKVNDLFSSNEDKDGEDDWAEFSSTEFDGHMDHVDPAAASGVKRGTQDTTQNDISSQNCNNADSKSIDSETETQPAEKHSEQFQNQDCSERTLSVTSDTDVSSHSCSHEKQDTLSPLESPDEDDFHCASVMKTLRSSVKGDTQEVTSQGSITDSGISSDISPGHKRNDSGEFAEFTDNKRVIHIVSHEPHQVDVITESNCDSPVGSDNAEPPAISSVSDNEATTDVDSTSGHSSGSEAALLAAEQADFCAHSADFCQSDATKATTSPESEFQSCSSSNDQEENADCTNSKISICDHSQSQDIPFQPDSNEPTSSEAVTESRTSETITTTDRSESKASDSIDTELVVRSADDQDDAGTDSDKEVLPLSGSVPDSCSDTGSLDPENASATKETESKHSSPEPESIDQDSGCKDFSDDDEFSGFKDAVETQMPSDIQRSESGNEFEFRNFDNTEPSSTTDTFTDAASTLLPVADNTSLPVMALCEDGSGSHENTTSPEDEEFTGFMDSKEDPDSMDLKFRSPSFAEEDDIPPVIDAENKDFDAFPSTEDTDAFSENVVPEPGDDGGDWAAFGGDDATPSGDQGDDWAAFQNPPAVLPVDAQDDFGDFDDSNEFEFGSFSETAASVPAELPTDPETSANRIAQSICGTYKTKPSSNLPADGAECLKVHVSEAVLRERQDTSAPPQPRVPITPLHPYRRPDPPKMIQVDIGVWHNLRDLENTAATKHQWMDSAHSEKVLQALGIDKRNILSIVKKSVPIFYSQSTLKPSRQPGDRKKDDVVLAYDQLIPDPDIPDHSTKANTPQDIPPAEFDWTSSGLTNPLDVLQKEQELLQAIEPTKAEPPKTLQPLETLLATMNFVPTAPPSVSKKNDEMAAYSKETETVLEKFKNLSFMQARVLMFPVKGESTGAN